MAEPTTRIYHNTTDKSINIVGIGEVRAHDRLSITAIYQPPVVMENYPGLVDLTDMTGDEQRAFDTQHSQNINNAAVARGESASPVALSTASVETE